mmetsp:Transcript_17750/g.49164  ORF Transcript_17750/g.49164 Transcript_17750/m.49164 type:complete len:102 (-) Transcript_17750:203-508(-)
MRDAAFRFLRSAFIRFPAVDDYLRDSVTTWHYHVSYQSENQVHNNIYELCEVTRDLKTVMCDVEGGVRILALLRCNGIIAIPVLNIIWSTIKQKRQKRPVA